MAKEFKTERRTIGPIPPRDKSGRLQIPAIIGRRVKLDELGVPMRDKDGHVLYENGDTRDPREYMAYEAGQRPTEEAIKGKKLFRVDLPPEPIALVYARHEDEAIKVYRAEFGITRFGESDPRVTEVSA